ncbi:uncharacterized protein TNCV_2407771 [Trichonephila clavipes]|nr:uncharacterized protein TNCV_2407771 [Trichonephila clavipes]
MWFTTKRSACIFLRRCVKCIGYSISSTMDWTGWSGKLAGLSCIDFFLWGHMKSLVYASPVDSNEALVAWIAIVAGDIQEMPEYLLMLNSPSADSVMPASLSLRYFLQFL